MARGHLAGSHHPLHGVVVVCGTCAKGLGLANVRAGSNASHRGEDGDESDRANKRWKDKGNERSRAWRLKRKRITNGSLTPRVVSRFAF